MSVQGSGRGREACSGLDWGQWGGIRGRECCIWAQLQRHLRASNLLPAEAIRRLETLNFVWEIQVRLCSPLCPLSLQSFQWSTGSSCLMKHLRWSLSYRGPALRSGFGAKGSGA